MHHQCLLLLRCATRLVGGRHPLLHAAGTPDWALEGWSTACFYRESFGAFRRTWRVSWPSILLLFLGSLTIDVWGITEVQRRRSPFRARGYKGHLPGAGRAASSFRSNVTALLVGRQIQSTECRQNVCCYGTLCTAANCNYDTLELGTVSKTPTRLLHGARHTTRKTFDVRHLRCCSTPYRKHHTDGAVLGCRWVRA
jgi:hypothetical protein